MDFELGDYIYRLVLKELGIKANEDLHVNSFIRYMHPYVFLRIIADNPRNENFNLQWRIGDVIDGGWENRGFFIKPLEKAHKILIVTEGKSDSRILKRVIEEFYSSIVDFFEFIDMKENYPFTGVGNLLNFYKGLAKINIQDKVLFIFDNDTAGVEKYSETKKINASPNLYACLLPCHSDFENFRTIGTEGEGYSNINGKAVTIECFLDFKNFDPHVRWIAYNEKMNQYQGTINPKAELISVFDKCNNLSAAYNTTKLVFLVDYLISLTTTNILDNPFKPNY